VVYSFKGNPLQSYGASPAIWDHGFSCHLTRWMRPTFKTSWYSIYMFSRMEGWVDCGGWMYNEMVYLSTDNYPSR